MKIWEFISIVIAIVVFSILSKLLGFEITVISLLVNILYGIYMKEK